MRPMRSSWIAGGVLVVALLAAGCTGNAEQGLKTAGQAESLSGQMRLQSAATAATGYFNENGTYVGFNATTAKSLEPSITWADGGAATDGVVTINGPSATSVALVTSEQGHVNCVGLTSGVQTTGTQDAQSAADCA